MNDLKKKLLSHLSENNLQPKRSLGQNFLINPRVVQCILDEVFRKTSDLIIEIGPGWGALTDYLEPEYKKNYLAVELDKKMAQFWREKNINVIEADALRVDWGELVPADKACVTLVSNLPYQIAASLVVERSFQPTNLKRMVLMFQKEVADRILASSGNKEYGLLTIIAQTYWDIRKVCAAGKRDFYPSPNVQSQVLSFQRKDNMTGENTDFLKFVKECFKQRRKYLLKNMAKYVPLTPTKDNVINLLQNWGFDEKVRAEKLNPKQFYELYELVRVRCQE